MRISEFKGAAASMLFALALAGCVTGSANLSADVARHYAAAVDGGFAMAAVPRAYLTERNRRVTVAYTGPEPVGTVVVDPYARYLYLVTGPQRALRYGIAVGEQGRNFSGSAVVRRKQHWPSWTPTPNMIRTNPELYAPYARGLPGGPPNPMGARALYLYQGGRDTFYRIHGTQESSAVGKATVAGCIRLFNQDAIDLFDRVPLGAQVKVRSAAESQRLEGVLRQGADGYLVQASPPPA
ncbi:L,D-transpeptidase [Rhodobacter ferrooxidans]|uniref:ErfK/YbiS/YcfS/YnhG family protein n=1 Tax=Rhodobacter ferrooxidans TaxID=371731 RepID=C8S2X8_9RHOB|nr:L,D-transpeptidase [Rhodobacter sp. SW2]EEW24618.1 ErfK/YbiS/YcfS/YnhG family protein [Rhodobacter sp. SW2]